MKQQDQFETAPQAESLADLPLTEEQADATRAGGLAPYGGFTGGVKVSV